MADTAQRPALVGRHDALRRILDHQQVVAAGDVHDGIHLAGHTCVMHRHDGLGARRDRRFDFALVDVQRIGTDIDKHRHGAAQHEGVGRGDEGKRRHDDLVARLQVGQHRGDFQRSRARMRQQRLLAADALLQPAIAFARELAVAGQVAAGVGLRDIPEFFAGHIRLIEGDVHIRIPMVETQCGMDEVRRIAACA